MKKNFAILFMVLGVLIALSVTAYAAINTSLLDKQAIKSSIGGTSSTASLKYISESGTGSMSSTTSGTGIGGASTTTSGLGSMSTISGPGTGTIISGSGARVTVTRRVATPTPTLAVRPRIFGPDQIMVGQTATYSILSAKSKPVEWYISAPGVKRLTYSKECYVAKVDSSGNVTGLSNGRFMLYCLLNGSIITSDIYEVVEVPTITFATNSIVLVEGQSQGFPAYTSSSAFNFKSVVWKSSNESVLRVDEDGITALKPGKAILKAVFDDIVSASCKVEVVKRTPYALTITLGTMSNPSLVSYTFGDQPITIVKPTLALVEVGERVSVRVKVVNDNISINEYCWNDGPMKVGTPYVPNNGRTNNKLKVHVVTESGLEGNATLTFVSKPTVVSSHTIDAYLDGTHILHDTNVGTSFFANTVYAKSGKNVEVYTETKGAPIQAIKVFWDDVYYTGVELQSDSSSNNIISYSHWYSFPIPAYGTSDSHTLMVVAYDTSGRSFSANVTFLKPRESYIDVSFVYDDIEYASYSETYYAPSQRTLYTVSQRDLALKEGDEVSIKVRTVNSPAKEAFCYVDEGRGIKKFEAKLDRRDDDDYYYTIKAVISANELNVKNESIDVTVRLENGGSLYVPFKYKRSDYHEAGKLVINTSDGEQTISEFSTSADDAVCMTVYNAYPEDTIIVTALGHNEHIATLEYQFDFGESYGIALSGDALEIEPGVFCHAEDFIIPYDASEGMHVLNIKASTTSGLTASLRQFINVTRVDKESYSIDLLIGNNIHGTYNWGTVSTTGLRSDYGFSVVANYTGLGETILSDRVTFTDNNCFAVRFNGYYNKRLEIETQLLVDGIVKSSLGGSAPQTGNGNSEVIYIECPPIYGQLADGTEFDYKVVVIADGEEILNTSIPLRFERFENIAVSVDLSKTYDYDDEIVFQLNRPLKRDEIIKVYVDNKNTKDKFGSWYSAKDNGQNIVVNVHKLLWRDYVINDNDYRENPIKIRVGYTKTGSSDVRMLNVDTVTGSDILKVTSRYMDEVDNYRYNLVKRGPYYAYSATSSDSDSIDMYELYNTPQYVTLEFKEDSTYTRTIEGGRGRLLSGLRSNVESGRAYIDPANMFIYYIYDNGNEGKPGAILESNSNNNVSKIAYKELHKYSVEFTDTQHEIVPTIAPIIHPTAYRVTSAPTLVPIIRPTGYRVTPTPTLAPPIAPTITPTRVPARPTVRPTIVPTVAPIPSSMADVDIYNANTDEFLTSVGDGNVARELNVKKNDIIRLDNLSVHDSRIKYVRIVLGKVSAQRAVDGFNVKIAVEDNNGQNGFSVKFQYLDENKNIIKDENGNEIIEEIVDINI